MRLRPRALVNLIAVACLFVTGQATLSAEDFQSFKPPGKFVYLDSHVMYIDCLGEAAPTVLIDVGLGDSSANWYKLAKKLSQEVRVCVYDRSGYGWSSTGPAERTTAQITFELNQLLERADIPGPYVIVGHYPVSRPINRRSR